jgi:hypothetical protein
MRDGNNHTIMHDDVFDGELVPFRLAIGNRPLAKSRGNDQDGHQDGEATTHFFLLISEKITV